MPGITSLFTLWSKQKTKCFEDEGEEGSDDGEDVGFETRKEVLHERQVAGAAEFEDEREWKVEGE